MQRHRVLMVLVHGVCTLTTRLKTLRKSFGHLQPGVEEMML